MSSRIDAFDHFSTKGIDAALSADISAPGKNFHWFQRKTHGIHSNATITDKQRRLPTYFVDNPVD